MGKNRKANAEHLMACANLFRAVGFDLMFPVCYVRVSSVHEVFCPGYLQFLYLHLSFVCLHSNLLIGGAIQWQISAAHILPLQVTNVPN